MKFRFGVVLCLAVAAFSANTAFAQQKTVKACQDEWRANKSANQAAKITEKAYVEKCRAGGGAMQPAQAPAAKTAAPAASTPSTAAKPAAAKPRAAPAAATPTPAMPAGTAGGKEFASEGQAKARCPSDTVVWVNLSSKIYHFAGKKDYGHTKSGAYMCEKDAMASGMRAAKNEKHP